MPEDLEPIVNLWYVADQGVIYSLRAKAYLGEGSDEEKVAFLRSRARLDYLIADSFPIPSRYHLMVDGEPAPVALQEPFTQSDREVVLFEDALKELEARFPAHSDLRIPTSPLVCVTVLSLKSDGTVAPKIDGERWLNG